MQSNTTVQVVELTIPNGTTAGTAVYVEDQFRSEFEKCIGYVLHVASNTSSASVNVSILLNRGDIIQDYVHHQHIEANASTPVDKRYHPADFKSRSEKFRVLAKPIANLTADVVIQIAFLLSK